MPKDEEARFTYGLRARWAAAWGSVEAGRRRRWVALFTKLERMRLLSVLCERALRLGEAELWAREWAGLGPKSADARARRLATATKGERARLVSVLGQRAAQLDRLCPSPETATWWEWTSDQVERRRVLSVMRARARQQGREFSKRTRFELWALSQEAPGRKATKRSPVRSRDGKG